MERKIRSESDLEIVWDDGTIEYKDRVPRPRVYTPPPEPVKASSLVPTVIALAAVGAVELVKAVL